MKQILKISGWGAVSPAGWSVAGLWDAVQDGSPLPITEASRGDYAPRRKLRHVPAWEGPAPAWMKHPRLRRASAASRFSIHAAATALGEERLAASRGGSWNLGVIFCAMSGCVQFSTRFFAEVLTDPALASPILFPETVYNAPSSHVSAQLGSTGVNATLVGDDSQFLSGLDLAMQWLIDGIVPACLVIAAEESDWMTEEAMMLFQKNSVAGEGAAALLLEKGEPAPGIRLNRIAGPYAYTNRISRAEAAQRVHHDLTGWESERSLLCHGLRGSPRLDAAESAAWTGWPGSRLGLHSVLGEGFGVSAGWKTVLACEALMRNSGLQNAHVSAIGLAQQALGAVFSRVL